MITVNDTEEANDTNANINKINGLRKAKLMKWINKYMKIEMSDGRILIGTFVCTDKDANVILSTCSELFNTESKNYLLFRITCICID